MSFYSIDATDGAQNQTTVLNYAINLAASRGSCSKLQIKIPHSLFRPLSQPKNSPLHEFVAKNDTDGYQWSEIVTITCGKGVSALDWRNNLKQGMSSKSKNPIVLEENVEDFGTYQKAYFVMSYTDERKYLVQLNDGTLKPIEKNRRELIVSRYYAGPHDAVNFQYSIALVNGMTEQMALKKIQEFEKEYVKVITE